MALAITYPAKSNVTIPTVLVIAKNIFTRVSLRGTWAWMGFSGKEKPGKQRKGRDAR
jgi:hypothetical protein